METDEGRGKRLGVEHLAAIEIRPGTTWDETLLSETYGIDLNEFLDASRLANELIEERGMIRLSVTSTIPTIAPSLGDFERHIPLGASIPEGVRREIGVKLGQFPDSLTVKQDLWIGLNDWTVVKMVVEGTAYRRGEVTESFVETRSFSKFDVAELPGPLPN